MPGRPNGDTEQTPLLQNGFHEHNQPVQVRFDEDGDEFSPR
jgi:hypothetical protein